MADIMLSTDMETKNAEKKISSLEKEINKLEKKKMPLETQMSSFNAKAQEARKNVASLRKELKSVSDLTNSDKEVLMKQDTALNEETYQNISKCKTEMQDFEAKADKAGEKIEEINSQISTLRARIDSLKFTGTPDASYGQIAETAKSGLEGAAKASEKLNAGLRESKKTSDELGKSVNKVDKATGQTASGMKSKLGAALKSTGKSFDNFGKRIANTFKSAFVFSVLYAGLNQLKQRLSAMLSTNQQFSNSLTQVKSNLAVAFQPIYQAAMPAINALLNLLVKATAYLAAFTNALLGTSMDSSIDAARKMQDSINAVQNGANGATAAEKALTAAIKEKQSQVKALQRENKKLQREYETQKKAVEAQTKALEKQIDALNKQIDSIQASEKALNKAAEAQRNAIQANIDALQKQQNAISKESSAVRKEQERAQKAADEQKASIDKQIKSINNQIKALQKRQKAEEKARKENQKFSADFDELSTLGSIEASDPLDLEIEQLQEQIELLQQQKESIEDIDYSVRLDTLDEENEKIQEQIDLLREQQDAIKDVDFSGSIEAYEAQISSLNEKIDELNKSVVENPLIEQNELLIEQLQEEIDLLQEQKDAIQESSNTASSFNSSGITKFNSKLDELKKKLEDSPLYNWLIDNKEEIKDFAIIIGTLAGAVTIALGVFKTFSSVLSVLGSPVGAIALVIVAMGLLLLFFGDTDAAVAALKETLYGFGKFLKGTFTGDVELAVEGLKGIFGGLKDFVLEVFDAIWNALQWIADKITEFIWTVEEIWGWYGRFSEKNSKKTYDNPSNTFDEIFNDSPPRYAPTTFSSDDIPALAQGTVIPPNKPFLAWLGDQKNGTNIEAPLSTIEDAVRNVMGEMDFNWNFTADGSLGALIRVLKLGLKREGKRETAFE